MIFVIVNVRQELLSYLVLVTKQKNVNVVFVQANILKFRKNLKRRKRRMNEICFSVIQTEYGFILDWRIWGLIFLGGMLGIFSSWVAFKIINLRRGEQT